MWRSHVMCAASPVLNVCAARKLHLSCNFLFAQARGFLKMSKCYKRVHVQLSPLSLRGKHFSEVWSWLCCTNITAQVIHKKERKKKINMAWDWSDCAITCSLTSSFGCFFIYSNFDYMMWPFECWELCFVIEKARLMIDSFLRNPPKIWTQTHRALFVQTCFYTSRSRFTFHLTLKMPTSQSVTSFLITLELKEVYNLVFVFCSYLCCWTCSHR